MTNLDELHAEFREFRAEMRGSLQTLTATKVGEHRIIETEQRTLAHKVDDMKVELDEVRSDVSEVRSEFRTAIAHARGWIAGAAAIAGIIAGIIATVGADLVRSFLNLA